MIDYRAFRNSDPPALCNIWRSQPPLRGLMQPMLPDVLEHHVFAKSFFERTGLIVAVENERVVGFAHAGFAPAAQPYQLNQRVGGTALVMAVESPERADVMQHLLQESEAYLVRHGVVELWGGATREIAPYYLGLYGGSDLRGVLVSDRLQMELYQRAGYVVQATSLILHRELAQFRPPVNREAMQLRRQSELSKVAEPVAENWWDTCLICGRERDQFQLAARDRRRVLGTATFWDIEPLATSWGVRAAGLWRLDLADEPNRAALATYLLGESLFALASTGPSLVEIVVDENDRIGRDAAAALGFQEVDRMVQLKKRLSE